MENSALLEEQKKRFQQILEFTYRGNKNLVGEAGTDPNAGGAPDAGGDPNAMPPMDGGMGGDPNAGGAPDAGVDPNAGGDPNAMPPMDGGMGGDPNAGGAPDAGADPNAGGAPQTPQGLNPQEDPNAMPPMDGGMGGDMSAQDFEGGTPGPDDDVVDISDLTDAQESTEDAVKEIGGKFDKVLKYLGQWEEMIKSNNEKIEDLKTEFEKRNPTQIEKLGMQTANSYPFNVTPEEYWKEKQATSNYSVDDDKNGKEQGQYVITKNDVDGATNWKGISDSLDDDDAIYHPTLKNTMGYGL